MIVKRAVECRTCSDMLTTLESFIPWKCLARPGHDHPDGTILIIHDDQLDRDVSCKGRVLSMAFNVREMISPSSTARLNPSALSSSSNIWTLPSLGSSESRVLLELSNSESGTLSSDSRIVSF